jgi:hypothetical protein
VDLADFNAKDESDLAEIKNRIVGSGEEPLDGILFNPRNWRIHPLSQQDALKGVLEEVGWVQQVIVNKHTGNLIDGHLRCQLAAREGQATVPVVYVDIDEAEEALVLATLDPIAAMAATDRVKLKELIDNVETENERVNKIMSDIAKRERVETPEPQDEDEEPLVYRVPDAVWGTDNIYGIPMLDLNMQADHLEAPFMGWGTKARKNRMTGTYHFYVSDDRFEQVWRNPIDIANSACYGIVEPNFSVYTDMPKAVALWQMFRRRWICRWLQSIGIRIFVDLNIAHRHDDLRFIGVPEGWKSYCTRAYSERLDETVIEYEQALKHAGDGSTILFVCYGGGKKAEELAREKGWIWYPDQQTNDAGGK